MNEFQKTTTTSRKSTNEWGTSRTTRTGEIETRQYVGPYSEPLRHTTASLHANVANPQADYVKTESKGFPAKTPDGSFVTVAITVERMRPDGGRDQSEVRSFLSLDLARELHSQLAEAIEKAEG